MLFTYPPKAAFNRVIPKTKFYEHAKPSPSLKARFVSEISQVVWSYKLAPETINLPPADGVQEIQVFSITLKEESIDESVLRAIDRSVPSPIIFELHRVKDAKTVAAFKRPSQADSNSWVVGDYFDTEWEELGKERSSLPLALNLGSLYETLLKSLAPIKCRVGETLQQLCERYASICSKQSERMKLEGKLKAEKQFNRKVELNSALRRIENELDELLSSTAQISNTTE
ncbi:DUF4391 domain-containing protein [Pirellulaceae bacterium SH449]